MRNELNMVIIGVDYDLSGQYIAFVDILPSLWS